MEGYEVGKWIALSCR